MALHSAFLGVLRQAVHSMAYQAVIDTIGRYLYPVVAHQVPKDACLSSMVSSAWVPDLLFYFTRRSQGEIPEAWCAIDEPRLSPFCICLFPFRKVLPAGAKLHAGL